MDLATARALSQLTSAFYEHVAASFSETRASAWPGWRQLLALVEREGVEPRFVLDLACGNLRFERLLAGWCSERGCAAGCRVDAYDSCDALVADQGAPGLDVRFHHLDLAEALLAGEDLAALLDAPTADLAVCLAFLHHLPLPEHRALALRALVEGVRPGGLVAVSLWQLSHSERLLAKARQTTREQLPRLGLGPLAVGDFLLGWQGSTDVLRYCHDFSEDEVDELAVSVAPLAREVARFSADGATGDLNRYLVLRRC